MNTTYLSEKLTRIDESVDSIRKEIGADTKVIEDVAAGVKQLNTNYKASQEEVATLNNTVAEKDLIIADKDTELTGLHEELEAEHEKVLTYIDMCDEQTKEINTLNERIAELENGGASGSSGIYHVASMEELDALLGV